MIDLRYAFTEAARDFSASPYLRHKEDFLTFSAVNPVLSQIASQLPPLGTRRIMILLPDSLSAALLYLECFSQGATIVPLSPHSPAALVQYVVEKVQPHVVFTTPLLHAKFADALRGKWVVLVTSSHPITLHVPTAGSFCDSSEQSSPVRAVFFTSGTTGKPKGVCLSESNLLGAAWINCTILGLGPSRRSMITVPLYDYYGLIQLYSHLLAKAACTVGESGQFPRSAFQLVSKQAITDIVLVPFTLRALLDYAETPKCEDCKEAWRSVSYVASSSDQIAPDLLQRAFMLNPDLVVVNVYGLTEAGRACYRVIRRGSKPGDSIGNPSPTMKVWVDAPTGQSGEIVISGPTTMLGYLQGIVNEQIHFAPVTEVRTADEGYVGGDQEIHLLGRKDHLINMHGVKLHPSEIELPVNKLPGVTDSMARLYQGNGNKTIVLDVVADQGRVTRDQILDLLRERVPRSFLPQVINFVDVIPRTEIGGKLIRAKQ